MYPWFFFIFIPQNNWKFIKRTQFLLAKSETNFFWKKMVWLFSYMCTVHKLFGYDLYWIMVLVLHTHGFVLKFSRNGQNKKHREVARLLIYMPSAKKKRGWLGWNKKLATIMSKIGRLEVKNIGSQMAALSKRTIQRHITQL